MARWHSMVLVMVPSFALAQESDPWNRSHYVDVRMTSAFLDAKYSYAVMDFGKIGVVVSPYDRPSIGGTFSIHPFKSLFVEGQLGEIAYSESATDSPIYKARYFWGVYIGGMYPLTSRYHLTIIAGQRVIHVEGGGSAVKDAVAGVGLGVSFE